MNTNDGHEKEKEDLKEEEIFKDPFWRSRAKIKISDKYI